MDLIEILAKGEIRLLEGGDIGLQLAATIAEMCKITGGKIETNKQISS